MSQSSVSHYAKGSVANILRSLLVIGAITAALFFMISRTSSVTAEQVDVVAAVEQHARQAGQPFEYAADLPEGWTPTSYRYVRSKDELMMWSATWTTPDGQYVAVQQVADATDSWVNTMANNGKQVGQVTTEDGRTWLKRDREGKVQRSLVHRQTGEGELTTLVTGTGTFEQLETFAEHLEAVEIPKS